jgi:hypothetical protein
MGMVPIYITNPWEIANPLRTILTNAGSYCTQPLLLEWLGPMPFQTVVPNNTIQPPLTTTRPNKSQQTWAWQECGLCGSQRTLKSRCLNPNIGFATRIEIGSPTLHKHRPQRPHNSSCLAVLGQACHSKSATRGSGLWQGLLPRPWKHYIVENSHFQTLLTFKKRVGIPGWYVPS